MIHLLSLGAGVQSSALALMAARGETPVRLDGAIFADTGDEPVSVYRWLDWLEAEIQRSAYPYPVHRVSAGVLSESALETKTRPDGRTYTRTPIPYFVKNPDGTQGRIASRQCTRDFKIAPILAAARRIAVVGRKPANPAPIVCQWIGISLDEIYRMKPSREWWAVNTWPLVDARMTRHDCIRWMAERGYPRPPRSACVFCPFHGNQEWRRLRDEEPEEFERAVKFEMAVQAAKKADDNFQGIPYLHRSLVPLDQVDLSTDLDRGQLSLFGEECEGMCGV